MTVLRTMAACVMALGVGAAALAQDEPFGVYVADFKDRAEAKGYDRALLDDTLSFAQPASSIIELDRNQSEFVKAIWDYLDSAVSESRIENGALELAEHAEIFAALEERFGVERSYLAAIWALESAYGAVIGDTDVPLALATLAWEGRRRAFFEKELYAVLDILGDGEADRGDLIGGWAGAMGQTQFMPTTYRAYAVDFDGDGRKDVWADTGDALASAARYLSDMGWRSGEPWGVEVTLRDGFDYAMADGREKAVGGWAVKGVVRADREPWSADEQFRQAALLLPAGANGPAFLVFKNFYVFKRYNAATSYALAAGLLGDTLAGKPGLIADWPRAERPLSRNQAKALQRALTDLGYSTGGVDGLIGRNSRAALRAWQTDRGLPADAFATTGVLEALEAELAAR